MRKTTVATVITAFALITTAASCETANADKEAAVTGGNAAVVTQEAEQKATTTTVKDTRTPQQRNAVKKAKQYLDYSAFSRSGLVKQLTFEGFANADATFAVDYLNPNWVEQAKKKAAEYMGYSSFSQQGLVDQLVFEGFTQEQAQAGAASQF